MRNNKKSIFLILITFIAFIFPNLAYSQDPITRNIKKGEKAPFDGVIMNYPAADKILKEHHRLIEKCKVDLEEQKDLLESKCKFDTDICKIELEVETKKHNELMQIKDEHIEYLEEMSLEDDWTDLYFVGGFVGGVLATSLIIFALD